MVNLSLVGASIRRPKSSTRYGQTPQLPLRDHADAKALALLRVALPADIPPDAVITTAILRLAQHRATAGNRTVWLRMGKASFAPGTVTWSTAPPEDASTQITMTKAAGPIRRLWDFDVTDHVQAWVSGAKKNYGWRLGTTSTATDVVFRGATAAALPARLILEWVAPGDPPSQLAPDEQVVAVTHPTATFLAAPETEALQLQIHTTTNFAAPDFDSGELPATAGELDLAETAFAGALAGTTYYWRARTRDSLGWSPWSDIASFSYVPKAALTIDSPTETADDSTPPILWTFAGIQEAWRVIVRDQAGNILSDSGRTPGTATEWTPPKAVAKEGATASIEVRVWDDVDRVATPGDPVWISAEQTYTLAGSSTVAGADAVAATREPYGPAIQLTATRETAPDGWVVVRDGVRLFRSDTPTQNFTWIDTTAAPGVEHTYRLAPVVNGKVSSQGPSTTILAKSDGVWLLDPETGERAVVWNQEEGTWTAEELAVVHQPIAGPPIRRVAYRSPMSGQIAGDLLDVTDYGTGTHLRAADSEAALWAFKSSEAEHIYRLVTPTLNIPVQVGNITAWPSPEATYAQRHQRVTFDWWQTGESPWSP